jgi:deoxyribonuclease V
MKVTIQHEWRVNRDQALEMQRELARRVCQTGEVTSPRLIAGVDISAGRAEKAATAAVVVLSYPGLDLMEVKVVNGMLDFPYVPGLLSFRESPLILMACEQLDLVPALILVDGQGIAHPRRMGLASHLGLLLDIPTIGCAKSRLCGHHEMPGTEAGSSAELMDNGEIIGTALRTKDRVKPLYVSIGHKVDLHAAIRWTLACCRGYRLPEPTRLAHLAAGGNLKNTLEPQLAHR